MVKRCGSGAAAGTVYLVRHGQTALNRSGHIRGRGDPPLDAVGVAEAEETARILARVQPVKIVSSPLVRAVQTAAVIAEASSVAHSIDARLIDRDFGQWTGCLELSVASLWGAATQAPGVETDESVVARALPVLEEAADNALTGPVLLITHDAIIRALLMTLSPVATGAQLPTGCWSTLIRAHGEWAVGPIGMTAATATLSGGDRS